jgi:phosphomannomutase
VAVPDETGWRALTGDELGVLLADHLIRSGRTGTYATTIVSSSLLSKLCAARGVPFGETLTGFKWIVRAADDLAYGYEEALGYCVLPEVVRDKDGISAALLVADLAAALKAEGRTLQDRLDELAAEFGRHATGQISVRVEDLRQIGATMAALREDPPRTLLGRPATAEDLRPYADVLRLRADGVRVVVRPSGTEPKLKAYLEVVGDPAGLAALRAELAPRLQSTAPN